MPIKSGKSKKQPASSAVTGAPIHSEAVATLLAFSDPPSKAAADKIAQDCVSGGLDAINVSGPYDPDSKIDFGAIDEQSCQDFANSIEICVDSQDYSVPSLTGAFVLMHRNATVITFGNLVDAISKLMKPKS